MRINQRSFFQLRRQIGLTLIELIVFIVIVSVAIVGVLSVLNITVMRSSDPLVQKQAQALAEGLLEEIQTAYFAYCDGADVQLKYARDVADCTDGIGDSYGLDSRETLPTPETRPYDTVKDYAWAEGISTPLDSVLPHEASVSAPAGYTAAVVIGPAALGDITLASGDALLIRVTVTNGNTQAVAEGYKTRQVPQ